MTESTKYCLHSELGAIVQQRLDGGVHGLLNKLTGIVTPTMLKTSCIRCKHAFGVPEVQV
jgi:hypothetical protein